MEKEQDGEKQAEEEEESKDGTQNERKHGTHFVFVNVCPRVNVRAHEYVCMGWIRCKEEGRRARGRVARTQPGRGKGLEGRRDRERERDAAKQRPSPISILIELNATSYLMPETRQKLQLNGDAISLYLPVHSS